jgi:hypothetical protein
VLHLLHIWIDGASPSHLRLGERHVTAAERSSINPVDIFAAQDIAKALMTIHRVHLIAGILLIGAFAFRP